MIKSPFLLLVSVLKGLNMFSLEVFLGGMLYRGDLTSLFIYVIQESSISRIPPFPLLETVHTAPPCLVCTLTTPRGLRASASPGPSCATALPPFRLCPRDSFCLGNRTIPCGHPLPSSLAHLSWGLSWKEHRLFEWSSLTTPPFGKISLLLS